MSVIIQKYKNNCKHPSDINEHLPTLFKYALECNHITETGVRTAVSSYAFGAALLFKGPTNKLIQVDIHSHPNIVTFNQECLKEGVNSIFYEESDLTCPIEPTELLFIDTWHIYGQLRRELARWHTHVSKYIILHDTAIDGIFGETLRAGATNIEELSSTSGIPKNEITIGLWPAVIEFLQIRPEWVIEKCYMNNNGLTVLKRI